MVERAQRMDREPAYKVQVADLRKNAQERLRVELHEFNGHDLLSLRVWVDRSGGHNPNAMVPSTKGVTIAASMIPQLREAFEAAERAATERGILKD